MQFIKYFIIVLIGFFLIPESDKKQIENQNRPNIIFILSDDHTTNAISSYGSIYSDIAPTPNIDKIAGEGAILKNVFATNSICGPSRASILTGTYSNVNGYYKNYKGGVFDNSQWTFPKELQKSDTYFFVDNEVSIMPSLSNWEIKITTKSIKFLEKYSLDNMIAKLKS